MKDTVRTAGFVQPRSRRLTEKETEALGRRMYIFLQLGTLMSAQAEELERELRGIGAFQYNAKHTLRKIQALAKSLWRETAFREADTEWLALFGKDGEKLENLINGVIDGHIKKIEYEVEDSTIKDLKAV